MLQVWLDGLVLLVEEREIRNDVFDDVGVGEGVDLGLLLGVCGDAACVLLVYISPAGYRHPESRKRFEARTQTSQCVDTIDVHRTASADTLSATPSEGQSRINLVLDPDQRVQHHRTRLLQIQRVALHARLRAWLIRVPSVDVEGLDLGIRVLCWLLDC